jgi:hypothetical protein
MQTFNIYPKDGEMFQAQIYKLELNKKRDGFILYADDAKPSKECYLPFEKIAAVVPESLREEPGDICFLVYLKDQTTPLKIYASAFDALEPTLVFKRHQKDIRGNPHDEYELDEIYIALSEVVAVLPADGLVGYRRRH